MIKADALGGRRPDLAAEVLPDIINLVARKTLFRVVGHPRAVLEAMQAAVARHPDAAVPCLEHGVDLAQSCLHRHPGFSIELVDHFSAGTPDLAFACLQKTHGAAAAKFFYWQKRLRLLVPGSQTEARTQEQGAVLGRLQR